MTERCARARLRGTGNPRAAAGAAHPRLPGVASLAATIVSLAVALTLLWPPRPALLWNASASSRVGLYSVTSPDHLSVGDTVVAWAPVRARRLAAARRYLPESVPLVKRVAAVSGDRVCTKRRIIFVNGRPAAIRRLRDPSGRRLPWWSGCEVLRAGDLLLLSAGSPEAFDGRYFGVTRGREIVGKATLLWAKPARGSNDG